MRTSGAGIPFQQGAQGEEANARCRGRGRRSWRFSILESGAALLCAGALALAFGTHPATADDVDVAGAQFTANGNTYSIVTLPEGAGTGTVRLTGIDRTTAQLVIPARVTSPTSGASYTVRAVGFSAFNGDTALEELTLPQSVVEIDAGMNGDFFHGCTALRSVTVKGGTGGLLESQDGVLYAKRDGKRATLLAYPCQKGDSSFDAPEDVSTVASGAFAKNEHVEKVSFRSDLDGEENWNGNTLFSGGILARAFEGCTALKTVSFPQEARIGTRLSSVGPAIGSSAFKGCTSLASLEIPALASANRKASAYDDFASLNPESTLAVGTDEIFTSGYMPYWHNTNGPVARAGIGDSAFAGCTSLASVTFAAGSKLGAFSYWTGGGSVFSGCTALKSLVFEGAQAYWGNPNASMQNGSFTDIWSPDYNDIEAPTHYYAVDYYATQDAAKAADAAGSTRLARVEYRRGTSTSDIATSADTLAEQTADRSLYAQADADGVIPEPDQAAAKAGLAGTGWVWKLDGTQARRGGLSESCRAYLAKGDDLSAGRIESAQTAALYLQADRNLSRGTVLCPESAFDVERFCDDANYSMTPLAGEASPYFTYNPTTGELDTGFSVVAADGTMLESTQYTTSWQRYDNKTRRLEDVNRIASGGAYLVTITAAGTGYSGSLSEWLLVHARAGNLVEAFGSTPAATENAAKYPYSQTTSLDFSGAPYSVTVGTSDVCGALVASSCAGLAHGGISIDTGKAAKKFGFELNRSTYPNGKVLDRSQTLAFTRTTAAPAYAVAVYERFSDTANRRSYGLPAADSGNSVWGDTALLVPLGHVADAASASAYAYAMRAPMFFTELDGSCSKSTLRSLREFSQVKVVGNTRLYPKGAFEKLQDQLESTSLSRLGGNAKNRGELSLAIADELVAAGKATWTTASISDARDPLDCILALNFTGHENGITLVTGSTAQSKDIMNRLHENIGGLSLVMLFGRSKGNATVVSSKSFGSKNALGAIWESDENFQAARESTVTTVGNVDFSSKTTDPDYERTRRRPKVKKKGASGNAKAAQSKAARTAHSSSGAASSTEADSGYADVEPPADRTIAQADADTARDDAGITKGTASASDSPTVQQASSPTDQNTDADEAQPPTDTTPSWAKALFIAILVACCAALIPVLRKCR